jgi:hypothetical protein
MPYILGFVLWVALGIVLGKGFSSIALRMQA